MKPLFSVFPTLLLTLACAFPVLADKSNNILDYASTKDIRDINPHLYSGEMAAQNMVFESLVLNTEKGVAPYLAQRWDISLTAKVILFIYAMM